ncbi:enoyl-CoA hydratase/isomerase family protein [Natrinema halophilum]|uniref:enoyl-CoA hydratase/isomerase family protein n=1 Tax=Natrinema halophilum TaxID=1699371 RepID=UPI001F44CA62|nr:enoyl-CoA hydratase/isomerase family protein [Natrinema halophilum]UHQ96109.1 enoyl-CoA hydratase/isomerase family protein [Natrinema halophilum]
MTAFDKISVTTDESNERIVHVLLDSEAQHNTLDLQTIQELDDAFTAADRKTDIDAIVLGTTSDVFCSGADLGTLTEMSFEEGTRWMSQYFEAIDVLRETGKPTIAAIEGVCAAGGNELAMGCDLIVAGESATFGQPEVGVGSTAAGGGVQLLPLLVGEKRAREMLLLGEMYPASQMQEWGLLNRVVPDGTARDEAVSLAEDIVSTKSPQAYRTIKSIMKTWTNIGMVNREMARDMTAAVWDSEEFRDRAESFVSGDEHTARSFTGSQPANKE